MSDGTKIEWTDATWNPIVGCSVVSPGCTNCYAMRLAGTRMKHHPSRAGLTRDSKAGPVWTGEVRFMEQWLIQPLRWAKPRMIFVCAHADLFHEAVPDEWIDRIFAVMAMAPQHTFQVLTKRPERMREYLHSPVVIDSIANAAHDIDGGIGAPILPLPNVWLGVSVEDQRRADERIPILLDTPAAVRWISAEPLLGLLDLARIVLISSDAPDLGKPDVSINALTGWLGSSAADMARLDWVVAGGESGPSARPMHPDWARSLRDQCEKAGVPFLFKQWGEWAPAEDYPSEIQEQYDVHGLADGHSIRVGKKAACRLLDGVIHDGYPEAFR